MTETLFPLEFWQERRLTHPLRSGRHTMPAQVVERSQRLRLLRAVLDVVAERGYADANLTEVVDLARVSRRTFYELFPNKEECFVTALTAYTGAALDAMSAAVADAGDDWRTHLRAVVHAYLDFLAAHPACTQATHVGALSGGETVQRVLVGNRALMADLLERVSRPAGEVPASLLGVCVGALMDVIRTKLTHGRAEGLLDDEDTVVEFATRVFEAGQR
ncbi:TetR/AcrR family transcriptional regulator [Actinokineospora pegani]|uniref:TetR/AcrR family transcriptional regulator n=1 Tax=Actinokineospora pegani TaxID=2654637 RepID=UPI0012EAD672|nr:TetR/AcrR family transcriptional regulator [Actinokineospora pegani]